MDMDVDGEMDEHALAEDIERVFTEMLPKRNEQTSLGPKSFYGKTSKIF